MLKNFFWTKRNSTLKRKGTLKRTCIIGVMGLSKGVGTTHTALIIAGFLHAYYGRKTLFAEVCQKNTLYHLFDSQNEKQLLIKHGIAYLLKAEQEDVIQIRNMGYSYCILDLGDNYLNSKDDLMHCDIKIIMGVGAVWQKDMWKLAKEILHEVKDCSTFCFLVNFGDISDKVKISLLPAKSYSMPYEPDLFHISEGTVYLFRKIFKEYS